MSVNIRAVLGKVPRIAGTLSELRYLVFEGQKGEKGDKGDPGADAEGAVRYDETQTLTDAQKNTACGNIGAIGQLEYDAIQQSLSALDADISLKADEADIPTKVSDLQNDTGYITASQVPAAPVQSVNGKTGSVTVNEVPAVGSTDSKKVLTADNGTYSWAAVPTGETTKRISLYKNSQTGVYTCSMTATQLHDALPNVVLSTEDYRVPLSAYAIDKTGVYVKAVFIDDRRESNSAIVWTLSAESSSDLVSVSRDEYSIEGLPDYSHAIDGQVLTKAQDGPRWANNNPSSGAALRLLYDGAFGPDEPELMLTGNVADAETGNAIATALYDGRIGSAVLVDVTDPNTEVVYDLFAVDYDAQTHVSTVVFARTEGALIRTATLSGSTKTAPVFGTIPLAGGSATDAVLYTQQSLSDSQKAQARTNVGAGTYSKPSGGIPASDLASGVQTSLGKAETALQSHQSLAAYRTATAQDTIDAGKLGTTGNAYRSASIPMGHLDATSTATVMTATVDGITELRDGVCMWLRNGVITSASGFTINVNGLGAKPCYSSLAAESRSTTIFNVNYTMLFVYNSTRVDGGCWDIVYGVDTNTTYTPVKLGFGYTTCSTAEATTAKTASLSSYTLTANGIVSVKFTNAVPANSTLNIASKGAKAMYYRGNPITAGVIKAGDTATFVYSTYYHLISIDRDEAGDTLPTVTASDNGKVLGVVNGAWGLKDDETGGGGGGGTSPTLLGTTPLKLTADADNLILSGSGEISYALQSDTVADFPVLSGTANNATVTQENGVYALTAGSGASAWYQAYIDITVTGLVVNQSYNFIFDAAGCEYNETTHRTVGHYILYDGSGNTLATRGATDANRLNSYAFTAPTTSVRVRWYPATNNTFSSGVSVATVNAIYINRTGTTEHTAILDASGAFTGSTTIPGVPAGTTVTSTPSCSVYSKASESGGAALPLEGKTVVCFGDSLFGLYRGSTSAPAYVEKVTGATVYNVGFGGCRMSDHPSHGYAEFSMWALAHAIATDTWTDQDTYVSQGSDYFPEQLATLKGIDFSTVDYAVIHYGTNDFGGGVAIGADSAATVHNTLCGALRYSIETLLTAYPKLRIFVSLPCFRFWTVDGQTVYSDTYTNSQGKTLVEYVAALRAVAGEYNIPVIENYTGNGINRVNASAFLGDGTHHNADGRERFGTYIAENLISGGSCGIAEAESNSFGGGA